jgi:hypothetical protein
LWVGKLAQVRLGTICGGIMPLLRLKRQKEKGQGREISGKTLPVCQQFDGVRKKKGKGEMIEGMLDEKNLGASVRTVSYLVSAGVLPSTPRPYSSFICFGAPGGGLGAVSPGSGKSRPSSAPSDLHVAGANPS